MKLFLIVAGAVCLSVGAPVSHLARTDDIDPSDSLEKEARAWLLRKQHGDTDESQTADQVIAKHSTSDLIAREASEGSASAGMGLGVNPADRLEMEARAWQIRKAKGFPSAMDVMTADEILKEHGGMQSSQEAAVV